MLAANDGQEALDPSVRVTASIGIALCPDHGDEVVSLLRHADLAMYDAKKAGGRRFVVRRNVDQAVETGS